jgi:hypothetical protein
MKIDMRGAAAHSHPKVEADRGVEMSPAKATAENKSARKSKSEINGGQTDADAQAPRKTAVVARSAPDERSAARSPNRLSFTFCSGEDPSAKSATVFARDRVRGSANQYGAFSIENFATSSPLFSTHEDVQGFYNYVSQFAVPNFWYRDADVKIWAYQEEFDNWDNTFGMDAVNVVYHSGHGGRTPDGKVWFPLGADWSGRGTDVWAHNMRLGNEHVNYVFWSTCYACPVDPPLNPLDTWGTANLGFRMLFGYQTVSLDSPNYGRFFFEEFNKGSTFSKAWMDASWRISTNQVPSVVACGASAAEAQHRLFNERSFESGHIIPNYWHWTWYDAARMTPRGVTARERRTEVPGDSMIAWLRPVERDANAVRSAIDRLGVRLQIPRDVAVDSFGGFRIGDTDNCVAFGADGSIDAQLQKHNYMNRALVPEEQAVKIAQDALNAHGLSHGPDLVFDRILLQREGRGSTQSRGELTEPSTIGTTVTFKQLINGLPVVTPGQGAVRVVVDNDSTVTRVVDSTRVVDRLTRGDSPSPTPEGQTRERAPRSDDGGVEQQIGSAWADLLARWVMKGRMPAGYTVVPGSTEVGYAIRGDQAFLVAVREVDVDFGSGLYKRYRIEAPMK